jgi:hypothetical protein
LEYTLYRLYSNDILKRKEAMKRLTAEDLVIEVCLKQYDSWAEEKAMEQAAKENKR